MSVEQRFVLFDNAKLRQEIEENKKTSEILMTLYGQRLCFWTKRGKRAESRP